MHSGTKMQIFPSTWYILFLCQAAVIVSETRLTHKTTCAFNEYMNHVKLYSLKSFMNFF